MGRMANAPFSASARTPRDTRLDTLRGLMLAEITLVHVGCPLGTFTNEMFGRVSVAAGFVFLSGLVAGAVYSRTAERGAGPIFRRCLRRGLYIHVYHLAAFVALVAALLTQPRFAEYFHFAMLPTVAGALRPLMYFAVWAYQPIDFDVLPMYALFVLAMPAALLALRADRGLLMLCVSLGLWACAQWGLGSRTPGPTTFGFFRGEFNPLAWQFVFFSGLYFGYRHLHQQCPIVRPQPLLIALCILLCMLGLTMRWQVVPWPAAFARGGLLASKADYGATYLVNFLAFAYLTYCLARVAPRAFQWRFLAFLGRHSIQVFSFQLVLVYLARPLYWRAAAHGALAFDALGLAVVAMLFLPAFCHASWQSWRTGLSAVGPRAYRSRG